MLNKFKKWLWSTYKVFFIYKRGFSYIYYKYYIAKKITHHTSSLERPVTHPNLSIHMLTCHKDAIIAAWSLASYYHFSKAIGPLTIHDDGTLTATDIAMFERIFPSATIGNTNDFFRKHDAEISKYPILKKFRTEFPEFQSKKLLDVYLERKGDIILFLDSDMLWFNNPTELVEAVESGAKNISYMMSTGVTNRVHVNYNDGTKTTDFVASCCSGITLFHKDNYSLEEVSQYIPKCDYLSRATIFSDQACFGTVLRHLVVLSNDRYFIKGALTPTTVLRHYTGPSREKFYFYGLDRVHRAILSLDA